MTYRIVNTDNFDGDYPNETFTDEGPFVFRDQAQVRADVMNEDLGEHSRRYYKVVEMPYTLQPGFEP